MSRLLPVSETMLFGVQPFIADMTAFALNNPIGTSTAMRASYKRRSQLIVDALAEAPGVVALPPEGGMFILLEVAGTGLTGEAFAMKLLEEEGVAVMPGSSFGDEARYFVRLSLTVSDDTIRKACDHVLALAGRLQPSRERRA